ncbi:MAG: hypothetical protein FWG63_01805 [Defluviitaleaceae bacterium]|nr:hypothetical protein [Defluviitaleaceae bacterium]
MEKTVVKRKTHTSYIVKKRYEEKTYDRVTTLVKKGRKEILKAHAAARGESLNRFVNRAVDEAMARDSLTLADISEKNTWESELATTLNGSEDEQLNISDFPRSNLSRGEVL